MKTAYLITLCFLVPIWACVPYGQDPDKKNIPDRPNILLLIADDLGYSDLGCYGGEIQTPNIDSLASRGWLFTNFHTAPTCAPTRAMILSGNNNHIAGMGQQGGGRGPYKGMPGYEGFLSDRIVPLPMLLKDAGYRTYTVGKWHLGTRIEDSPKSKGFDRSYNLLQGASNHYYSIGLQGSDSVSLFMENGVLVSYPEGRYSTEFYTSRLLDFFDADKDNINPFFAFVAFTSPHWPLQAPEEFIEKYRGKGYYDEGYDKLREQRFGALKNAGIIPANATIPPRLQEVRPWGELNEDEKKREARKMELYAAMVDNLDFHVGRIINYLKQNGLYENTLIIFISDNGAAANDFYHQDPFKPFLQSHYDNSYENMGAATSFVSYGAPWALAGAAPFNRYKGYATEGGTTAPMIITGPGITAGQIKRDYLTVMDFMPTFLEIAGVAYPGKYGTEKIKPMLGESMVSYLKGATNQAHSSDYVSGLEQHGHAFIRKENWKIVHFGSPFNEQNFKLFNLDLDLAETTDLAPQQPEKYQEMLKHWQDLSAEAGIVFPD